MVPPCASTASLQNARGVVQLLRKLAGASAWSCRTWPMACSGGASCTSLRCVPRESAPRWRAPLLGSGRCRRPWPGRRLPRSDRCLRSTTRSRCTTMISRRSRKRRRLRLRPRSCTSSVMRSTQGTLPARSSSGSSVRTSAPPPGYPSLGSTRTDRAMRKPSLGGRARSEAAYTTLSVSLALTSRRRSWRRRRRSWPGRRRPPWRLPRSRPASPWRPSRPPSWPSRTPPPPRPS